MIGDDKISEIRERASIVEVVSDHLTLKKMGLNQIGLCHFHSEKTPSFTVNEEKGIFHCFGCGVGGNIFNFLMNYEHLTFPEAVERVAKRYGIRVDPVERPSARREEKEGLSRLNEKAANYFYKALRDHPEGARAVKYLRHRGVEDQVARRFYLGYAPANGQGLAQSLQKEGVSMKDAVSLGLLSEKGIDRYGESFLGVSCFPSLIRVERLWVLAEGSLEKDYRSISTLRTPLSFTRVPSSTVSTRRRRPSAPWTGWLSWKVIWMSLP